MTSIKQGAQLDRGLLSYPHFNKIYMTVKFVLDRKLPTLESRRNALVSRAQNIKRGTKNHCQRKTRRACSQKVPFTVGNYPCMSVYIATCWTIIGLRWRLIADLGR